MGGMYVATFILYGIIVPTKFVQFSDDENGDNDYGTVEHEWKKFRPAKYKNIICKCMSTSGSGRYEVTRHNPTYGFGILVKEGSDPNTLVNLIPDDMNEILIQFRDQYLDKYEGQKEFLQKSKQEKIKMSSIGIYSGFKTNHK
jgi:hypothetical protein